MAPYANKNTNRARVTEKLRRQWNAREKIAIITYYEKGYTIVKEVLLQNLR